MKSRFAAEKAAREKANLKRQQALEEMIKAREAEPQYVDYGKREMTINNIARELGIFNVDEQNEEE